ncbi:MAG: VOC family protein [Candidatus Nanohaloarchaea archaeon]
METAGIDHVNIRIPEDGVDEALEFYRGVLGMEPEKLDLYREGERTSFAFRISRGSLLHVRPVEDFETPEDHSFDHFCILFEGGIEDLKEALEEGGVGIEREGTPWGAEGRGPAVYVRDPFGYLVELKKATSTTV